MNKILLTIVGVLAWASAGASAADTTAMKAAKEELAKFNQTGQFERCISQNAIKNATIIDDTKIMFELRNNKYVLNTLKDSILEMRSSGICFLKRNLRR